MTSPIDQVRQALNDGASTRSSIARTTGLSRLLVDAVLDHMLATGSLEREVQPTACSGRCTGCELIDEHTGSCHTAKADRNGLVVLRLATPHFPA
ncbi:FeoC-like transcriptional regulator [Corynebacterium breve]|uniref:FeoC-like transcriptional regulator n=1 Tax=Corynebacterium breve TaxID=3049799 RepID=A0ABY8VCG2_9CORY|nr:FeoC-like transcriptional regulator [Corynebacterium breve]WIM66787.1 FeoC-like transcriptional regulator [Corynebacterium breve]